MKNPTLSHRFLLAFLIFLIAPAGALALAAPPYQGLQRDANSGRTPAAPESRIYLPLVASPRTQPNQAPDVPSNPSPAANAGAVSVAVTLSWSGTDPDGDTLTFDVYLQANDTSPDVLVSANQAGTSFAPATLAPETQYYWQIVARDEFGLATNGPVWSFATGPAEPCAIALALQPAQVAGQTVTVGGTVSSACSTVTRLEWAWGDGSSDDQWFPASHDYTQYSTYIITATAHGDLGNSEVATTTVQVADTSNMAYIPAGEFQMGCDPSNPAQSCNDDELLHAVSLDAYYIDKYEITNGEYRACVNAGACNPPMQNSSHTRTYYHDNSLYQDYPVIYVSWYDANDYCAWVGKRLPSEAEWEKAAGEDLYPWGDEAPDCSRLNYKHYRDDGTSYYCTNDTTAVGSYPSGASPYGVLDMSGNVHEWVSDWYQEDYYASSPYANPPGPDSGTYKVERGGGFYSKAAFVRSAHRSNSYATSRLYSRGFRCVAAGQ